MSYLEIVRAVDERLNVIANELQKDENADFAKSQVPGLAPLLRDVIDENVNVSKDDFTQRLLRVFQDSEDQTYEDQLGKLTPLEKHELERFVAGKKTTDDIDEGVTGLPSLGVREELRLMKEAKLSKLHEIKEHLLTHLSHIKSWFMKDETFDLGPLSAFKDLKLHSNAEFQNWGRTVNNVPSMTFVPKNVEEIQGIVRFAKARKLGVRASGYRHSWSPAFSENGQILISMLDLKKVNTLPDTESLCRVKPASELEDISFVDDGFNDQNKRLVRIGCAATNERFRQWCNGTGMVSLPLNVIMVEITFGGSNAPICHGAGRKNETLSDLVHEIEYVDAHGELHKVNRADKQFLGAASGCFGLIGIITHITLEVDKMRCALLRPRKLPAYLAIPPPPEMSYDDIPVNLRPRAPTNEAEKLKQDNDRANAQKDFERRAHDDFYAEWFWFPYSDYVWVNTWDVDSDTSGALEYPDKVKKVRQWLETFVGNVMQNATVLEKLFEVTHLQQTATTIQSRYAMFSMDDVQPEEPPIKTLLPNALHFRRGIQNMRVLDIEVEMPLPTTSNDPAAKPDYTIAQRAWWDGILECYKHSHDCPQRMPLEMRIMGGSSVTMAPQRGNAATCSIEVLTPHAQRDLWQDYAQEVLNTWMDPQKYKDPKSGTRLKTRPHWAKQWYEFKVDNKRWIEKLRDEDYKAEIAEFKQKLAALGERDGWSLADIKQRFSNDMLNELIMFDVNTNGDSRAPL